MAVPGRGADRRHRTARLELAGEGLVAVEGLRAGEAGELGRDVGQREAAGGARGDRGEVEDRAAASGSASCASSKTASEKKAGRPAALQALPSQARKLASSTTQACQPGRGTSRIQAPSTQ